MLLLTPTAVDPPFPQQIWFYGTSNTIPSLVLSDQIDLDNASTILWFAELFGNEYSTTYKIARNENMFRESPGVLLFARRRFNNFRWYARSAKCFLHFLEALLLVETKARSNIDITQLKNGTLLFSFFETAVLRLRHSSLCHQSSAAKKRVSRKSIQQRGHPVREHIACPPQWNPSRQSATVCPKNNMPHAFLHWE